MVQIMPARPLDEELLSVPEEDDMYDRHLPGGREDILSTPPPHGVGVSDRTLVASPPNVHRIAGIHKKTASSNCSNNTTPVTVCSSANSSQVSPSGPPPGLFLPSFDIPDEWHEENRNGSSPRGIQVDVKQKQHPLRIVLQPKRSQIARILIPKDGYAETSPRISLADLSSESSDDDDTLDAPDHVIFHSFSTAGSFPSLMMPSLTYDDLPPNTSVVPLELPGISEIPSRDVHVAPVQVEARPRKPDHKADRKTKTLDHWTEWFTICFACGVSQSPYGRNKKAKVHPEPLRRQISI